MMPLCLKILGLCVLLFHVAGESFALESTRLDKVRFGVHDAYSRLVFDAEGGRPVRVEHSEEGKITLSFHQLQSSLPSRVTSENPASLVRAVEIVNTGKQGRILIHFAGGQAGFKHHYLDGVSPGGSGYRLVFDFVPQAKAAPREQASTQHRSRDARTASSPSRPPRPREKVDPTLQPLPGKTPLMEQAAKPETTTADVQSEPTPLPDVLSLCLKKSEALMKDRRFGDAEAAFRHCLDETTQDKGLRLLALYEFADTYYQYHEENLEEAGPDVLTAYSQAIHAGNLGQRTRLALFRTGLTCQKMGDWKRAETYFLQFVRNHPQDPLVGGCWINLARIYLAAESYLETTQAARKALNHPLSSQEMAEAHCLIATGHHMLGEPQGAVEGFEKCLELQPAAYLSNPQLLRQLGESYFSLKDYRRSLENLLHYLNLINAASDRDLIMARIAETLTSLGEIDLAEKLRYFLASQYPETEGAVIAQLRMAEAYESLEPAQSQKAYDIYEQLLRKPSPPPLRDLVKLKLAGWHWRFGDLNESLKIITDTLDEDAKGKSNEDFYLLKEKVVSALIKQAAAGRDHETVVGLYAENSTMLKQQSSPEILTVIGESLGALGLYPEAIALYQEMVKSGRGSKTDVVKLAEYHFLAGEVQKAVELISRTGSEKSPLKSRLLGRIATAQGNHAEAVEHFSGLLKEVSAASREDLDCLPAYAESLLKTGRAADSLKWAERGLQLLDDKDAELAMTFQLSRVAALRELQRWDEAAGILEDLLASTEESDMRYRLTYQLSTVYRQGGMEGQAVERLTQLLESPDAFWQSVARQQLGYLQLKKEGLLDL